MATCIKQEREVEKVTRPMLGGVQNCSKSVMRTTKY